VTPAQRCMSDSSVIQATMVLTAGTKLRWFDEGSHQQNGLTTGQPVCSPCAVMIRKYAASEYDLQLSDEGTVTPSPEERFWRLEI
jgi:hypothetical protein